MIWLSAADQVLPESRYEIVALEDQRTSQGTALRKVDARIRQRVMGPACQRRTG